MRAIGTLPSESDAKVLADHLLSLEIQTTVRPARDGFAVWVLQEDQVERARSELEAFRANRSDPRYQASQQQAKEVRKQEQIKEKVFKKNFVDLAGRWDSQAFSRRGRSLTMALILVSGVVSVWTGFGQKAENKLFQALVIASFDDASVSPVDARPRFEQIRQGQVWRLITPIFLHFSFPHLLFNTYALFILGGMIEGRRGALRLALLVLISAAASNVAQYEWTGPSFGGMSGVVFALFGYVLVQGIVFGDPAMRLHPNSIIIMFAWLVLCMTGAVGHVANAAHVVGLASGLAMGFEPLVHRG